MSDASLEKKRRRMRQQYAGMEAEDKEVLLRRKRAYMMGIRHNVPSSDQSTITGVAGGSAVPSTSTPAAHVVPSGRYDHTSIFL